MDQASQAIYRLNPVSCRYKAEIEPSRLRSFVLIAEEVEKVDPHLVLRTRKERFTACDTIR